MGAKTAPVGGRKPFMGFGLDSLSRVIDLLPSIRGPAVLVQETRKMNTTNSVLLAASGTLLLTSVASAAVLLPGSSAGISGWSAMTGDLVYSKTYSFTAVGVPIGVPTATGTIEQSIYSLTSGELVFSLSITSLEADPGLVLSSMKLTDWAGFSVDADFVIGSGLSAPMQVARSSGSGNIVEWTNFEESLSDGKNSATMQIVSNAIGYLPDTARLHLTFNDGSFANVRIAAPSMIPAPGVASLLLGAAFCGIRRRR